MKKLLDKIVDFFKKYYDQTVDYFKTLTKTAKNIWIVALVIVLILILILIINGIRLSKKKKLLRKDTLTGKKNYKYFSKIMKKKYRKNRYSLAIVDFNDTKLKETYDRSLYKNVIVEFSNVIKKSINRKDYFARTDYNEYIIATKKKKKLNLDTYYSKLEKNLSNLKIKKEIINPSFQIVVNEGLGDTFDVELTRAFISLNKSCDKLVKVTPIDIEESSKFEELTKILRPQLEENKANVIFKPIVDIKYAKIRLALCGIEINGQTSFDETFKNAILKENLDYTVTKEIITKLSDIYKSEIDITFVLPVSFSFNEEMFIELNKMIEESNLRRDSIILAFSQSDYYQNNNLEVLNTLKEFGYKTALLDLGEKLDFNALLDFDLVTIDSNFILRYKNESNVISYNKLLETSNSIKAIKIETLEDIKLLKNNEVYPYVYSDLYFKDLTSLELLTFNRIQSLLNEEVFNKKELVIKEAEEKVVERVIYVTKNEEDTKKEDSTLENNEELETKEEEVIEDTKEEIAEEIEIIEDEEPAIEDEEPAIEDEEPAIEDEESFEEDTDSDDDEDLDEDLDTDSEIEDYTTSENDEPFKFPKIVSKPFYQKMALASPEVLEFYNGLNNFFAKYEGVRNQVSKQGETFRYKNKTCGKIRLSGKTLKLYLDLNPSLYKTTRFHQKDVSDMKKYARTPMMVKIKSHTALKKACVLIEDMAKIYDMQEVAYEEKDFAKELLQLNK